MKIVTGLVIGFLVFGMVGAANAAIIFPDDFEDGNHDGWLTRGIADLMNGSHLQTSTTIILF